ncbi:MAG: PilZ domain-containing protein [Magnetococcales bacterium]|nr:PilZ domain-containing protein [Magnetococcales bacterium]
MDAKTPSPSDLDDLKPLDPFFRTYMRRFVAHFEKNYKEIHQIDLDRTGRQAAGHVFLRHFIPSFEEKPHPRMTPEIEERYRQLLNEQKAFSLTILEMTQDLMIFQNQASARQMAAFQQFLSRNLPSGGGLEPPKPEEFEAAAAEVTAQTTLTPILDLLARIQAGRISLKTINLYQDVPVTNEAQVLELLPERNQARIGLERTQAAIIRKEGHTYFKSPNLPGLVKGYVISLDAHEPVAVMGRFHLANPRNARRENVRVRPALPIKIVLTSKGETFSGKLLDISLHGLGIELPRSDPLNIDEAVDVELFLPPSYEFTLSGTVVGARKLEAGGSSLGLKIFPGKREEAILNGYIKERQKEVLLELKKISEREEIRLPTFNKERR